LVFWYGKIPGEVVNKNFNVDLQQNVVQQRFKGWVLVIIDMVITEQMKEPADT
jgi:hypothetical protein